MGIRATAWRESAQLPRHAGLATTFPPSDKEAFDAMFRLRTLIVMWLARRAWKLAGWAYRRRQRRRPRTAY